METIALESEDGLDDDVPWRGCSMTEIYRGLSQWELKHAPPIKPSDSHTVLYHFPIKNFNEPPKPLRDHGKWDAFHVRLPCSSKNQYTVAKDDGTTDIESRWELIEKALLRPICSSRELEAAILSYNSKYEKIWKFRSLHKLFEEDIDEEEERSFFESLLPQIIRLALRLPELVSAPIPLLKQGQNRSITLSQQQISCLLANAFLCTYPRRNTTKRKSEYSSFPDINFSRLFQSTGPQVIEKIKCICNYFRRVTHETPLGVVTFTRRSITEKELPKWEECNAPLGVTPLHVTSRGTIEDQGKGLLQVDFANKYLGGGVLGSGCVQEEIRFVICPELLISKLFTEALRPCEALVMIGCEQFSKYSGYASSFTCGGNFKDITPFDEYRRRQCTIVAIDALHFVEASHQYREELILRELNKAYVGFVHPLDTPAPGVASGNWGCGAFGGEATLKALIQIMACTVTKRPLVYFTFGNVELRDAIHQMHTFFIENNITVKELWSYLKKFRTQKLSPSELYRFICQMHSDDKKPSPQLTNSWRQNWPKFLAPVRKSNPKASSSSDGTLSSPRKKRDLNLSEDLFSPDSSPEMKSIEAIDVRTEETASKVAETLPKKGLRQVSLLDMLDSCYKGTPPKKHC